MRTSLLPFCALTLAASARAETPPGARPGDDVLTGSQIQAELAPIGARVR